MQANQSISKQIQQAESMNESTVAQALSKLIHLNEESEVGFDAAAHHVRNRGLKIWLKSCAQQRQQFAKELIDFQNSQNVTTSSSKLQSFFARLHRGWIDVRSIMVIGRKDTEQFILEQVQWAEDNVILRNYSQMLDTNRPSALNQILEKQFAQIEKVSQQLSLMIGNSEKQLLVQLFDSQDDAESAITEMRDMKTSIFNTDVKSMEDVMNYYKAAQSNRTIEIASASIILGIVVGSVSGLAISAATSFSADTISSIPFATLGGFFGIFCGLLFGLIAGYSNVEEDQHIYEDAIETGKVFLFTQIQKEQVPTVRHLLRQTRWTKQQPATYAS